MKQTQPWLKFYPADYRADAALRTCSISARGLWIEMLCLMWASDPKGSLLINGRQVAPKTLASLAVISARDADTLIAELEHAGVFSRDEDGTIFSRRMRRDVAKAERDKANGRSGGNPVLKQLDNRGVNPPLNPPVKSRPNPNLNPEDIVSDKPVDKARVRTTYIPEARLYPSHERNHLNSDRPLRLADASEFGSTSTDNGGLPETGNDCAHGWDNDDPFGDGGRS